MKTRLEILRELMQLDDQYEEITGHNGYLYARNIDGHSVFFFVDECRMDSPAGALAHMKELVIQAAQELGGGA